MSAIANVVIADAVPANKTLYPLSAGIAESVWQERAAVSMAGNRRLSAGVSLSHSKRPTDRVNVLFKCPKEALVDGLTTVVNTGVFEGHLVIPEDWTDTERNNFATEVANLMTNAVVKDLARRNVPY